MMEGYLELRKAEEELEWNRTAQLAVWVLNPFIKKKLTVDMLLSKDKDKKEKTTSQDLSDMVEDMTVGLTLSQDPQKKEEEEEER